MASISVLGAGRMGAALVTAFAKAGHEVTVWNRTEAKARALTATGARVARSLEETTSADLVVDIVSDYASSQALVRRPAIARALAGKTFLELASGTPRAAKEAGAWAKENGIRYLDGAIVATPDFIGQPGCTILYAGERDVYDAHAPVLAAIAPGGVHVGVDIGHANVLDNAVLALVWGTVHGMFQGAAICEAERFPIEAFASSLTSSWPVVLPLLQSALARIGARRWPADAATQSVLAPCLASSAHILEISREHGIDVGLPEAVHRLFDRAASAGHRDDDVAAAYTAMR